MPYYINVFSSTTNSSKTFDLETYDTRLTELEKTRILYIEKSGNGHSTKYYEKLNFLPNKKFNSFSCSAIRQPDSSADGQFGIYKLLKNEVVYTTVSLSKKIKEFDIGKLTVECVASTSTMNTYLITFIETIDGVTMTIQDYFEIPNTADIFIGYYNVKLSGILFY